MTRTLIRLLPFVMAVVPAMGQEHQHAGGPTDRRMEMQHNPQFLVTGGWVASRLDSASLVVLHVGRSDSAYLAGHVPGARFLPLSAVGTTVGGIPNQFPTADQMAATFRDLGVGESAKIVIYGDDPGLFAARAWVALDLLGHGGRAALLDGGLVRWRAAGRPAETGARSAAAQPFIARWRGDLVVDAEWVRAHLGDATVVLVDARPADQFSGAEAPGPEAIPEGRRGHIPGAKSMPWMDALASREDPALKPMHALHHELWEPAGADRARTVVTYCRTGMKASHSYFVARYIGYPDVRLYDGSFIEWSALGAHDHPVENGGR